MDNIPDMECLEDTKKMTRNTGTPLAAKSFSKSITWNIYFILFKLQSSK